MAIPEAQLETWSNQGGTKAAEATYTSVKAALSDYGSLVKDKDYELFLQGSYRNSTNIYRDSDVDIVARLNEAYTSDISSLDEAQARAYRRDVTPARYTWMDFRRDLLASLQKYYGSNFVKDGNKALKVLPASGRLPADVLRAILHRNYSYYYSSVVQGYVEGIKFWDKAGREIVNYPKQHIENGQAKNQRASGRYKPTVRMLKNARNHLIDKGRIDKGLAPSYFCECLTYNLPDTLFVSGTQDTMLGILNYWYSNSVAGSVCQNGIVPLFGPTPEQWELNDANKLTSNLIYLWNNWPI